MPVANKKKVQTLINVVCEAVDALKVADDKLGRVRAAYADQEVDPAGTALEGHVAEITGWMDDVKAAADSVVANGFLAHRAPTHRNTALGDIFNGP